MKIEGVVKAMISEYPIKREMKQCVHISNCNDDFLDPSQRLLFRGKKDEIMTQNVTTNLAKFDMNQTILLLTSNAGTL